MLRRSIYCITKLDAGLNECDVRLRLLCEVELVLEPVLRAREIAELVQLDTYRPPEPEETDTKTLTRLSASEYGRFRHSVFASATSQMEWLRLNNPLHPIQSE